MTLVFRIRKAKTEWGQGIRVVGSIPELGAWQPELSIGLSTSEEAYPEWRSRELIVPCPADSTGSLCLEYKYVLDCTHGDGFQWEDLGQNRRVEMPLLPGMTIVVDDDALGRRASAHWITDGSPFG
jgi:alpha-amylase